MLRLLVPAVLFLASTVLWLWGGDISAGWRGGWDHGQAQARAEGRRARETWGGTRSGRGVRAAAGHARRFWDGMRGPRPGAPAGSPGAAVPAGKGPAYRIGQAVRVGGLAAIAGGRGAARGARDEITTGVRGARGWWSRRPRPGIPRPGPGATGPAGTRPGGRTWRRAPKTPRVPTGVCDNCGRFVGRPSLQPTSGGLWCLICRNATTPQPGTGPAVPAIPAPRLGDTPVSPGTPRPEVTAGTGWPSAAAVAGAIPGGAVAAGTGWPALTAGADSPGTSPAALPAGTPTAAQPALTGGTMTTRALTSGRAAIATRGGGQAVRVDGGGIVHGRAVTYVGMIVNALNEMWREQQMMLSDLHSVDGSVDQIADVEAWADEITGVARQTRAWVMSFDKRLKPLVDQITALGGPSKVASAAYHSDH